MKFGARPLQFAPASSTQRDLFRCRTTYLAKIAVILQDAPNKMLTFNQVVKETNGVPLPGECNERINKSPADVFLADGQVGAADVRGEKICREQHPSLFISQQMLCQGKSIVVCQSPLQVVR